ncbi:ATP-binding cassette domain-containing protein [Petralouisia muris]|uniref:ATP-binding cassette domain-containing protein n=1 Tax=Petralouisia muris TaxID=3032872 RepID=A0AC61RMS6_9FIRM|nr:ATP-binding cassette domain-containing protein [Petralouisia muris]
MRKENATVLKDITGIKLAGGGFINPVELRLFDPLDGNKVKLPKGTILYGRNGSGKSTIAKAIKKVVKGGYPHITQATVLDKDGNIITLTEDEKERIFVFDEEFVDSNIKLQEAGLNTIVMLGRQVDLANQIQQAEREMDIAKQEYENQQALVSNEYENRNNPKSPKYYIDQMRYALQGDDNWAGRDKIVKEGRQNTGVRDETYKQFLSFSPVKSRDELIVLFNEKLNALYQAQKGAEAINVKVPRFTMKYDDSAIMDLLAVKIEKPILSDREKYLLQLVQNGKSNTLAEMAGVFGDASIKECPFCLQPLTNAYKKSLFDSIQKILSKIVEQHQHELQKLIVEEVKINLSAYEKLGDKKTVCENLIERINQSIRDNNQKLQSKIADPYSPIEIDVTTVSVLLGNLEDALTNLEESRLEFNKSVQATAPIKKELNKINGEIAYYDIHQLSSKHEAQQQEYVCAQRKETEKKNVFLQKKQLVDELEANRKNIQIALNVINNSLKYIFFSNDRLRIEYQNDTYVLLSNGHAVKPSEVSLGERNIIALCYFFANIMQNKEITTTYDKEYLIIIDDPVSSFDIENKIGIMSFLKYQLGKFLHGNIDTKALVMTHDLMTFYDLDKVFEELIGECGQKFQSKNLKFNRFELNQQTLQMFRYKQRQEYTELVKVIYEYALGNGNSYDIIIGNILRQVLEAFATFQYKKGIEEVSTDSYILDALPEEEYKLYFYNLMYRLVLHGGSHREEQVKALDDMNFFSVVSNTDKQRTAKDVLCFIYLLNEKHVISHLKDYGNSASANLEQWCNDIRTRSIVE